MDTTAFRISVRLSLGGDVVEVDTLNEAAEFLRHWPAARRGPVYTCALKGCEAALGGTMKVEDARRAFESFARITGILVNSRRIAVGPGATGLSFPGTAVRH
ncbi:DUF982 domain-containing protein [Pseudaminobacter sp. 19-2017]|uniref:DUF982 domain-containing protein n=1 Tax=Pseudaminobacter soli (ex Zhang et al. 2022) TaxID=2831468 RepID=A0A942DX21_9HYPH|nr:DUF982 domain-containing protein [Pseudaminobacter soli]MBS3648901.1 DUF982 domain-containing protein [Pseudaminobacter soli]